MEYEYEEEIRDVVIDDPVFNEVYDSENRREMTERRARRRETRGDCIEFIRELQEENREENRVYRDRLLTLLETLISAFNREG
jgi:hypothetical protein